MPAPLHGSIAGLLFNGYDLSPYLNSLTDSDMVAADEETCFGPLGSPVTAKSYIAGLEDATLDAAGKFAEDHITVDEIDDVMALATRGAGPLPACYFPFGDGFGKGVGGYQALKTKYDVQSPVSGIITTAVSFQAKGGGEPLEVLQPLVSEAATGNGASLDAGALYDSTKWKGLVAYLHVTALAGAGQSITCKVQHSADGVTWTDLATFAAITVAHKAVRLETLATVQRYLRAQWTLPAGVTGTFHLAAGRIPA